MKSRLMYCCLFVVGTFFSTSSQAQILSKLKTAISKIQETKTDTTKTTTTTNSNSSSLTNITKNEATLGVKEALSNGLNVSIQSLSKKNGFLGDAAVKILMPAEAQKVEKALRAVGMGSVCDRFIESMNRAAETAVSEAGSVFVNSLSKMSITDAYKILLSGQQDAATTFFKTSTSTELGTKFSPIIESAMGTNKVNLYWNQLTTAYNKLPLAKKVETNLTSYVTQKAIDGLFVKVADQELKIRQNIGGSRSSDLLGKVFGWTDGQK